MSDTKFTKGEWRVVENADSDPHFTHLVLVSHSRIAVVAYEHNAHLIAAAPDLYAALEAMEKHFGILGEEDSGINKTAIKVTKAARAALQKARGEA